ncbi:MAG: hypothetical protein EA394_09525 [Bacteroidia bacterium]|nr:MAG: hypothetical protein EA394_09525 [Bacteroidia bacterium]
MNAARTVGSKGLQIGLIVVVAILLLSIIGNIIYMRRSGRLADEKQQLTTEKEALQDEKKTLNETITVKDGVIEDKQNQLDALIVEHENMIREKDARIAQLNRRAAANANDLKAEQERNAKLKEDIDELDAKMEELTNEIYIQKQEMDALASAYQQLQEKAKLADVLNVYNVCALTKWDRWLCADRYNVSKARRVDYTFVSFEVDGTLFTEAGTKKIHLLLLNPQGELMYPSSEQFTIVEERAGDVQIQDHAYTLMKQINYAHEPVKVDFVLEHPERLGAGTYTAKIYIDGKLSRTEEMILE